MKLLAYVTTLYMYYGCSTWKMSWEEKFTLGEFTPVNMKIVVLAMLENTEIPRIVTSTSTWTSR